jgi:hypothetical protein
MSDAEVVSGELVRAEPEPAGALTLWATDDPEVALARMSELSRLLVGVVRHRGLVSKISGNDYLRAPAWTVLAGLAGLAPGTAWVRPLEDGRGYMARVEVRRVADGVVLGGAEQVCTREGRWSRAADHELVGMCQTRAASRALRMLLEPIVELSGYQSTPAEEMPAPEESNQSPIHPVEATTEQRAEVQRLLTRLNKLRPEADWKRRCREITGGPTKLMTVTVANMLIGKLEQSVQAAERFDTPEAQPE